MPPKKDPNKPKGRTSAYAFYVQERRDIYRKNGDTVVFAPFSQECAELWKNVKDKKAYQDMAAVDKERYDREMAEYVPPDDGEKSKKKKQKDKTKPKRSLTAFLFFCSEERPKMKEKNPGSSVGDLAKLLGAKWKGMSEDDKQPFSDMAQDDKDRYNDEMALWKKGQFNRQEEEEGADYSEEED
uniref:High mobility group box protein HMGB2 n=1 Tax=Suberites domuncula TaxID=55567 RepID=Q6T4W0_SUBDO|nr:high mobility group box protein HMGB2 [Suberites domuncula]